MASKNSSHLEGEDESEGDQLFANTRDAHYDSCVNLVNITIAIHFDYV